MTTTSPPSAEQLLEYPTTLSDSIDQLLQVVGWLRRHSASGLPLAVEKTEEMYDVGHVLKTAYSALWGVAGAMSPPNPWAMPDK